MLRRFSLLVCKLLVTGLLGCGAGATQTPETKRDPWSEVPAGQRRNLLFIMTDQQRWDTIAYGGNGYMATPNLDRLAREGVLFQNFYATTAVCVPARAAILTGRTPESNGIRSNDDYTANYTPATTPGAAVPTFDNILASGGYYTEYWGKWHIPMKYSTSYVNKVRPINGKTTDAPAVETETAAFRAFLVANNVATGVPTVPGDQVDEMGRSYKPIALDTYPITRAQEDQYGMLRAPAELSLTAFSAQETLNALARAHASGKPFSITCSMGPPHPPMVLAEPYYGLFPAAGLPVPASLNDPMTDSPYRTQAMTSSQIARYRNAQNIKEMKQIYYGMIADTDVWVGKLLQKLDDLGLTSKTLVVFTSDHGEMLGDHGMNSKTVFYEGSAHIPLIMRLPGSIPAGKRVPEPAGQYDLFPTILDYLEAPAAPCDGQSLRRLIEKQDGVVDADRISISQRKGSKGPTLMVRSGTYKLMLNADGADPTADALYDLQADPEEMTNLIGRSRSDADRQSPLVVANGMVVKAATFFKQSPSSTAQALGTQLQSRVIK